MDAVADLRRLLALPDGPVTAAPETHDTRAFLRAIAPALAGVPPGVEQALAGAVFADRPAQAAAAGHQAALRRLDRTLALSAIASFCATEEAGNHPRAITTELAAAGGTLRVTGAKRWATMAPIADVLLVVASEGFAYGRNQLRVVRIHSPAENLEIEPLPATGTMPELPHALVRLRGVRVDPADVLPGDGYLDAVKPFRTIEDLAIAAALLAFTLRLARRADWPPAEQERLLALVAAARGLADQPTDATGTHLALAGLERLIANLRAEQRPLVEALGAPERERCLRDLYGDSPARAAREARRAAAWRRLAERP